MKNAVYLKYESISFCATYISFINGNIHKIFT